MMDVSLMLHNMLPVPVCSCSVPRLMGYAHVRTGVQLNAMGKLKFERKTKDVLGEGREVADVVTVSSL